MMQNGKSGTLVLNENDYRKTPVLGSHDPSMMWDPVTERYYSYSTDVCLPGFGLIDKIGIPVRSSKDLVHFQYEGTVLSKQAIEEGRDNGAHPPTVNFWAPYVEYVYGEYRMYYSATKTFGSSESRIWLATASHPLGPFENRGIVADTWGTDDTFPNAIDAHVIWSGERAFLVYGSFFGGIYIKELDSRTGLASDPQMKHMGICISRKSAHPRIDGPEGASVIYVPETGYFYLFQSYGWLGDNYDIRAGRSRQAEGPYLDAKGKNLVEESMGFKIANSYFFHAENPPAGNSDPNWEFAGFRGPGHGVPFQDPKDGRYYFVHHVRDGALSGRSYDKEEKRYSYGPHYMMIRPMFFIDGWPVLGPEPYTGETFEPVDPKEAEGAWELIFLDDESNEIKTPKIHMLDRNHPYLKRAKIYSCRDFENQKKTLVLSGIDKLSIAYWGKFTYSNFR